MIGTRHDPTPNPVFSGNFAIWRAATLGAMVALASCSDGANSRPDAGATPDGAVATPDLGTGGTADAGAGGDSAPDRPPAADTATPIDTPPVDRGADGARPDTGTVLDVSAPPDLPAGAFNPCPPAGTPCRIMPLGDSITFGIGSPTMSGYRVPLFRKARAANRSMTFVGTMTSGPATVDGVPFPQQNEGHRTFLIDTIGTRAGLAPLVPAAMMNHKPHIVTLMIGTNDTSSATYAPEAPQRLGALVDRVIAADPNALVVVARIIPQGVAANNQRVITFNNALPAVVNARSAMGKHVVLVDMYQAIVSDPNYLQTLMTDNLHPNDAGFEKMADVWWAVVGPLLR